MNTSIEICSMKIKRAKIILTKLVPLIAGGALTGLLQLLNHYKLIFLNLELTLSPLIVATLLAYAEFLLTYCGRSLCSVILKVIKSKKSIENRVQSQISCKQE